MASLSNGLADAKTLQNFNNFETEENLQFINTTYGETYACVDFYKQPAVDHPSMKHYSIHYKMRPTSSLRSSKINNTNFGYLWENGVGCPIGTIPIKRVTKDQLVKLESFSETFRPQGSWNFNDIQSEVHSNQHHFAVSRTKEEQGRFYTGASMSLSVNNPKVKSPQFSSSRMHVQIGDDFIQMGWTVDPNLYSDSQTRLFVYTKSGENQCYDSMCASGFISVRSDFPLGHVLAPSGVRGLSSFISTYALLKDKANGNWWFVFQGKEIGFWPASRFKQNVANNIEWGGESTRILRLMIG
ncbi:hypothetical protein AALP_AA6G322200 [Arabis alpina]|uniref:Neprosin PEP catalytic domain-containing protein n=1 Tax=Arabis alpina TaxID=50452 RepID=A0A087GT33_ARAAL|nr:hypothetical protein AALP_AA6G322200 [Arabis alpina]